MNSRKIAAALLLSCAFFSWSNAAITVTTGKHDSDTITEGWGEVPNIDPISNTDYNATIEADSGLNGSFGGLEVLKDGIGGTAVGDAAKGILFTSSNAYLLLDLGAVKTITHINSYSAWPDVRACQKYTLYGSNESAKPATWTSPSTDTATWTKIADVDTTGLGEGGFHGAKVHDDAGGNIGQYRWLVFNMVSSGGYYSETVYREIDVFVDSSQELADFSTTGATATSISCTWEAYANATGYELEYSLNSDFSNSNKVDVTGGNATTKTIEGVFPLQAYYVRARAKLANSQFSDYASSLIVKTLNDATVNTMVAYQSATFYDDKTWETSLNSAFLNTIGPISNEDYGDNSSGNVVVTYGSSLQGNSGQNKINDGVGPNNTNDPGNVTFFNDTASSNDTILMSLGSLQNIRQINTYSVHVSDRGPQIYTLYGSTSVVAPATSDPANSADWFELVTVDTRSQGTGGFHGVKLTASKNSSQTNIGAFSHLLWKVTPAAAQWGATFYAEFDVWTEDQFTPALGLTSTVKNSEQGTLVSWQVETEVDVKEYQVKKRIGSNWIIIESVATGDGKYQVLDESADGEEYVVVVVDNNGYNQKFSASGDQSVYINLQKGWNLISVPFAVTADVLAAKGVGSIWTWSGIGYEATKALNSQQGAWIYAPEAKDVKFTGIPGNGMITLKKGWRLTGPVENGSAPSGLITYGWDNAYLQSGIMSLGKGYWIYTAQQKTIYLPER